MIYRIYTEYRPGLAAIVAKHFDGFTMLAPAIGYWKGVPEHTQVIEIALDSDCGAFAGHSRIVALADAIRVANHQESVLVVGITANTVLVTAKVTK